MHHLQKVKVICKLSVVDFAPTYPSMTTETINLHHFFPKHTRFGTKRDCRVKFPLFHGDGTHGVLVCSNEHNWLCGQVKKSARVLAIVSMVTSLIGLLGAPTSSEAHCWHVTRCSW